MDEQMQPRNELRKQKRREEVRKMTRFCQRAGVLPVQMSKNWYSITAELSKRPNSAQEERR